MHVASPLDCIVEPFCSVPLGNHLLNLGTGEWPAGLGHPAHAPHLRVPLLDRGHSGADHSSSADATLSRHHAPKSRALTITAATILTGRMRDLLRARRPLVDLASEPEAAPHDDLGRLDDRPRESAHRASRACARVILTFRLASPLLAALRFVRFDCRLARLLRLDSRESVRLGWPALLSRSETRARDPLQGLLYRILFS